MFIDSYKQKTSAKFYDGLCVSSKPTRVRSVSARMRDQLITREEVTRKFLVFLVMSRLRI